MTEPEPPGGEPVRWIDGRDYPVLAVIWDNEDDAIVDTLGDASEEPTAPEVAKPPA
ncbi:MAG: hypothetical protein ABIQ47_08650 [Tepidiformaceae bacterium]